MFLACCAGCLNQGWSVSWGCCCCSWGWWCAVCYYLVDLVLKGVNRENVSDSTVINVNIYKHSLLKTSEHVALKPCFSPFCLHLYWSCHCCNGPAVHFMCACDFSSFRCSVNEAVRTVFLTVAASKYKTCDEQNIKLTTLAMWMEQQNWYLLICNCCITLLHWSIGYSSSSAESSTVSSCRRHSYSKVSALSSIPFSWGQPGQVTDRQLDRWDRLTATSSRKHKHSEVLFWVHESLPLGVQLDSR